VPIRASLPAGSRTAHLVFTDRRDGDLAWASRGVDRRRAAVAPGPWTWLRQVHGPAVVTVRNAGEHAGREADAAVTAVDGAVVAVSVADCAPLALVSDGGGVAVVHAGWRGLADGVIEAAADALRAEAPGVLHAVLGPCVRSGCYEFGAVDLDRVAGLLGDEVRAVTVSGTPALDLPAGVAAACARAGVADLDDLGLCTACDGGTWFSHRARAEAGRQVLAAWLAPS